MITHRLYRITYDVVKEMDMEHFIGFLNTSSAIKTMREKNPGMSPDPLKTIETELSPHTRNRTTDINTLLFQVHVRVRIHGRL